MRLRSACLNSIVPGRFWSRPSVSSLHSTVARNVSTRKTVVKTCILVIEMVPQFCLPEGSDLVISVTSLPDTAGSSVCCIRIFDCAVLQGPFPKSFWCVLHSGNVCRSDIGDFLPVDRLKIRRAQVSRREVDVLES